MVKRVYSYKKKQIYEMMLLSERKMPKNSAVMACL